VPGGARGTHQCQPKEPAMREEGEEPRLSAKFKFLGMLSLGL
jgi:hypothetical protein